MIELTPELSLKTLEPLNAGTPVETLGREFVTPASRFFIRSHGTIPLVDPAHYRLTLDGLVERPFSLSLTELASLFERHQVTATLQCAGNRRTELQAVKPIKGEVSWTLDGISTGVWEGWRLCELLAAAGVFPEARHVQFEGLDTVEKENQTFGFGGSVPLSKAWQSEVLLADRLNGQPLSAEHGFPLRAVIPGYIGARSVKWLHRIKVAGEPSANFFQTRAYKVFSPEVEPFAADWPGAQALGASLVNSVITSPAVEASLAAGHPFTIEGYAIGAEGAAVETVEVSADNGQTWQPAVLSSTPTLALAESATEPALTAHSWAWRLWRVTIQLPPGRYTLVVRATDTAGNRQPADLRTVWNFKGYMNNAWHRLDINVTASTAARNN